MAARKKPTATDWERARALFGVGKTLREIERETGIPFKTIDRRAKSGEWSTTQTTQKITDVARVVEDLTQANDTEKKIILDEAEKILKAKGYTQNIGLLGLKRLSQLIPAAKTTKEVKDGMEAAKVAMVVTGVVDYYPPKAEPPKPEPTPDRMKIEIVGVKPTS